MLGFKKKKKPLVPVIRDPMAVVPMLAPNVTLLKTDKEILHLKQTTPVTGVRKWLTRKFGYDYTRTLELDDSGTHYIALMDGQRTLREITDEMVKKLGRPDDVEKAVIVFTKKLMTKQWIILRVTPESQQGSR